MGYSNILTLTGLPGSGKTTIGNKLAQKLNYKFIDLDNYIISKHNKTIVSIFDLFGENTFREYESNALEEILNSVKEKKSVVISLGGGTICSNNNLNLCLNSTTLIWLNTSLDIIYNRLSKSIIKNRPIFSNTNLHIKLHELYAQRLPYYNQSHIKINISKVNINNTLASILDNINNYNAK